ncbi:MAG: hypothetical protein AAGM27_10760 [Cyanobacteria bacterium J06554_3]
MYDITQLTLQDVATIGAHLRKLGKDAGSVETVATRCVEYLRDSLALPGTQEPACALARFFKTCNYQDLPSELKKQAVSASGQQGDLPNTVKCLTLMGTTGEQSDWCDRHTSKGHQSIPLTSEKAISQIPMISQLIKGLGLEISCVLAPSPHLWMELERKTCNVFYIETALGSEFIPAQSSFVEPFGIQSVLGFGGMLSSGDLFTVILFTKAKVPASTANLLKMLPLNLKMAMTPYLRENTFRVAHTV